MTQAPMKCISRALSCAVPFFKQNFKKFRSLKGEIMASLVCQKALAVFPSPGFRLSLEHKGRP